MISFSKQVWTFSPKIGVITSVMKSSELIIDFRLKSRVESSAEVFFVKFLILDNVAIIIWS